MGGLFLRESLLTNSIGKPSNAPIELVDRSVLQQRRDPLAGAVPAVGDRDDFGGVGGVRLAGSCGGAMRDPPDRLCGEFEDEGIGA